MAQVKTRAKSTSHLSNLVGTGRELLVSELPTVRDILRYGIYLRDQSKDDRRNYPVDQLVDDIFPGLIGQWSKANALFKPPVINEKVTIMPKLKECQSSCERGGCDGCVMQAHINCSCSREKRIPLKDLAYIKGQKEKVGSKRPHQMGAPDLQEHKRQAEFGFNEQHQNEVINYMRFARSKRVLRLKTIDSCFEELKDSRLVEETFTAALLTGREVLPPTAEDLLEQVAEFEKTDFKTPDKKNQETSKPKLAPLNEGGVSELLNKEIARLQEENDKLKTRLRTLESQATSALDDRSKAERALKDLQKVQGEQQFAARSQEIGSLEDTVAALKVDYEKSLSANSVSHKSLQENLISAKHDLLRVQEQLSLAEKELDKKFQQTAAYRNMKEILTKKNEQIKEIRKRLQRYEPSE
ncbi:hypothetical protein KUCAC02_017487 [Chaenocephalus aceratus]|uniref:Uncharacterized protein n=1 Tax=Chaenocephalus aceratus TaxID=36190 RepID=A0ACB9W1X1_CHAAC|nr:hypothetical protein KUCAC02_017487 [Chaenocephalus aceratus]